MVQIWSSECELTISVGGDRLGQSSVQRVLFTTKLCIQSWYWHSGFQSVWVTEEINRMEMWFSIDCFAWLIWFGADLYGPMTV